MSLVDELASRFKAQLASQFISAVAGGLLIVGLARLLDPDGYGLLFLSLSVIGVFQMVARLGIGRSAGRYVSEYKEIDQTQIPYIVRTSLLVNIVALTVTALILAVSYRYIASFLNEPELVPFLLLGVLLVGLGTANTFVEKVLQGFEAITFVAGWEIFGRISRLLIALGLVVSGFGALGALWGYVISAMLMTAIGFVYLFRRVRSVRNNTARVEPGLRRRIVEYAIPITATNTAKVLDKRVDTVLVGYFLSPVAVSYYVLGSQVVSFVETPMSALGFTLSPSFGAQKAAGNIDQVSRIYEQALTKGLLLYAPMGAGIVLVADPMIHLVFGADYAGAIVVLQVLGVYAMLQAVTKVTSNGLDFLGRARERAIAKGVVSVLNVALNIMLIPLLGVVGAAIATVITHGIYTVVTVYIAAQEFDLRFSFILQNLGVVGGITVVMSAVVFVLIDFISGWITLGLVVAIGVLVWAVLSVVTGQLEIKKFVSIMT